MFPYRCLSPKCRESGNAHTTQFFPEVERGVPVANSKCEFCEKSIHLTRLTVIHLLVPVPEGQPYDLKSSFAHHNWNFACDKAKTMNEEGKELRYSDAKEAITCYSCVEALKSGKVQLEYAEE